MTTSGMQMPSARYVLPSFIEHSTYGTKETNPYAKLFEERIIFLGTQVMIPLPMTSWRSYWCWRGLILIVTSRCTSTLQAALLPP